MSGEAGEELDTPAARIRARRESRAAMPDRLKEAAADDSSDEEWIADDHEETFRTEKRKGRWGGVPGEFHSSNIWCLLGRRARFPHKPGLLPPS